MQYDFLHIFSSFRKSFTLLLFSRFSTMKIEVERVNQAIKLTRTEVNNIVDVAVNCIQIVEQILRQSPCSALSTA